MLNPARIAAAISHQSAAPPAAIPVPTKCFKAAAPCAAIPPRLLTLRTLNQIKKVHPATIISLNLFRHGHISFLL